MTGEGWWVRERANAEPRWVVFGEHAGYMHINEDVEAVQCYCNN